MKIFAIKDDSYEKGLELAYLFFYEKTNEWYIELSDEVEKWQLPILLDSVVDSNRIVPFYWAKKWVQQRVIPSDRQNIAAILVEAGLEEYDEFKLFELADGRCAQDECYIKRISEQDLPESVKRRREKCIATATCASDKLDYMLTLDNGTVLLFNPTDSKDEIAWVERLTEYADKLGVAKVVAGGSSLSWQGDRELDYEYIVNNSTKLPIKADTLYAFSENEVISTTEAMNILNCSRQNIDDLVKRGRLKPADIEGKSRMFFKRDVLNL